MSPPSSAPSARPSWGACRLVVGAILCISVHLYYFYFYTVISLRGINGHLDGTLNSRLIDLSAPYVTEHKSVPRELANKWASLGMQSPLYKSGGIYFHFNRDQYLDAVRNEGYGKDWRQWLLPLINATIDLECCNTFITNLVLISPGRKTKSVSGWHTDNRLIFRPFYMPKVTPAKVTLLYAHVPEGMEGGRLFVTLPNEKGVPEREETIYPFNGKVVSIRGDTLHSIEAFNLSKPPEGSPMLLPSQRHMRVTFVLEQHRLPETSLSYMPAGFRCNPGLREKIEAAVLATLSAALGDGRCGSIYVVIYIVFLPILIVLGFYFSVARFELGVFEVISFLSALMGIYIMYDTAEFVDKELNLNEYTGYVIRLGTFPSVWGWIIRPLEVLWIYQMHATIGVLYLGIFFRAFHWYCCHHRGGRRNSHIEGEDADEDDTLQIRSSDTSSSLGSSKFKSE